MKILLFSYRRIHGFRSVDELYRADSSCHYLCNIRVPMVLINARDDPLVAPNLLTVPELFASQFYYITLY